MTIGDQLATRLHERFMKPIGFRKKAHTYSREHDEYGEHYNIQGSAWNSIDLPWTFYFNCGISFPDLPVKAPGVGMWKYHAHTRITRFDKTAPSQYEITDGNIDEVIDQLGTSILKCVGYFEKAHGVLRQSYLDNHYDAGFPHDPQNKIC